MLRIEVKSNLNPYLKYLDILEGNFELGVGIRCVVVFLNQNEEILEKKTFKIEGDEFNRWQKEENFFSLSMYILQEYNCAKVAD